MLVLSSTFTDKIISSQKLSGSYQNRHFLMKRFRVHQMEYQIQKNNIFQDQHFLDPNKKHILM